MTRTDAINFKFRISSSNKIFFNIFKEYVDSGILMELNHNRIFFIQRGFAIQFVKGLLFAHNFYYIVVNFVFLASKFSYFYFDF